MTVGAPPDAATYDPANSVFGIEKGTVWFSHRAYSGLRKGQSGFLTVRIRDWERDSLVFSP